MEASFLEHLSKLNPSQMQAVRAYGGPILVSAGAGTGKTRVLILRYAHLVLERQVLPQRIMAVTFTNKAAQEIRHRLQSFFPTQSLWVGTFHSLALRILRQNHSLIQRSSNFIVVDASDQNGLMTKILKDVADRKDHLTPQNILSYIGQWKQKGLLPHQISIQNKKEETILALYKEYQERLDQMDALDFDDLLLQNILLFQNHPQRLAHYQEMLPHVLVDEYQDVNSAQSQWLKFWSGEGLFCVGDDDQSIYGWRGANIENMLDFSKNFKGAQIFYLEDNYRSTPHILAAASHLISHNQSRYGKVLRTSQKQGEKVQVQGLQDSEEEVLFVTEKILHYHREGTGYSSMAVLLRTGAQTREFEEKFILRSIPYILVGSTKFYERQEIRDFLSYLRLLHSPTDVLAFERILNVPKRGIGSVTLKKIYDLARQEHIVMEEAARRVAEGMTSGIIRQGLTLFCQQLEKWRQAPKDSLSTWANHILAESGYFAMWKEQGIQGEGRLENLLELVKSLDQFSSLGDFLEHVSLLMETYSQPQSEAVSIMTLHAAKGLEFHTVFLPCWDENVFPHIRSLEADGKKGIEEERRLAYVGITRARERCWISFAWTRKMFQGWISSGPSCFINELPPSDILLSLHPERKRTFAEKNLKNNGQEFYSEKKCLSQKAVNPEHPASYFRPSRPTRFQKGQFVYHSLFGRGIVQQENGDIISVSFDHQGLKKVMSRFLSAKSL